MFCVLNWGLGHASRSIPIINKLLEHNCRVEIASDGDALLLLQEEYPTFKIHELPSYNMQYGSKRTMALRLLLQLPHLRSVIRKEHLAIQKIVTDQSFDRIISDNRYGCYADVIDSYMVTHQLQIHLRFQIFSPIVEHFFARYLKPFKMILIPDDPKINLSGDLIENKRIHISRKKFIGILGRLKQKPRSNHYQWLFLLSGPEPARSIFEQTLVQCFQNSKTSICMIRGTNRNTTTEFPDHFTVLNLATTEVVNEMILKSEMIVSRSGYSSLMDYVHLQVNAILVPTPGQPEQEYLANHVQHLPQFETIAQEEMNHKILAELKAKLEHQIQMDVISDENHLLDEFMTSHISNPSD